jgi:hypothetical protein
MNSQLNISEPQSQVAMYAESFDKENQSSLVMVDSQVVIKPSNRFSIKALRQVQPSLGGLNLQQRALMKIR